MGPALICAVVLFLLAAVILAVRARAPAPPPLPEPPAELPDNIIPFPPRRADAAPPAASRAE